MGGALAGRNVVVTGSGGGLGGAVVDALRAAGAVVHAPQRTALDTGDEGAVSAFFAGLPALWASVHLVGGYQAAPLLDTTAADARQQWELNFLTAFLCTREAARRMKAGGGGGRIVNVASRPALVPAGGVIAYGAAKAALVSMTVSAAIELKPDGILVNAVAPSLIDTAQNRRAMPNADFTTWPKPAEIATTILWLCSMDNALTSGTVVPVFGRA